MKSVQMSGDKSKRIKVEASGFQATLKDAWEYYARAFDLTQLADPRNQSLITNQVWSAMGCVFGQHTVSASLFDHTKKHVNECGYLLCVHRYLSGGSYGTLGEHAYSTPPRTIGFRDYSSLYKGVQMPGISQGVYVSAEQVGFDPSRHVGMLSYSEQTTFGRVLNAEFDYFYDQLNAGATDLDAKRVERLLACFTLAITGPKASIDIRRQAREALRDTIGLFIEQNLQSEHLTTNTLLQRFGVSRATLFRMFENDGGVKTYISQRRLLHAMVDLASKKTLRGQISNVAERWGFSSLQQFHRSVKNVFGVSPGSLFEHPMRHQGITRRGSVFADFMHESLNRAPAGPSSAVSA